MDNILGRILALIVAALAIVGVYEAYSGAQDSQKIASLQTQLGQIQQQVTTQYQRRPGRYNFGTLTAATMIQSQLVPSSAVNGTTVTNPFNGSYAINGNGAGANSPVSTYLVIADAIPVDDCIKIVKQFGTGGGLTGGPIYGYSVAATISGGGTVTTTIPDTDANANTTCNGPGSDTVAITFVLNG